ncbi:hypothetical protein Tco_1210896 [Tanacetum coccineum]
MASHHSKSIYAIKECSTCGSLYTKDCCSIGSLNDKILVSESNSSPCCAKCGTPVDGLSCRGCAFLRKKFDEDLLTYCVENGIFQDFQNTSESSDDNTNVVNALREPCVVNQDPGVKSSQDPPQIDHNCCYECGDSLDGIFCQRCICKSCGKGAHYGYNCPPKDPIISKPEPRNQTINEIPQTLPSLDPSCYSLPHVSKPNFVDNSPNFSYPPPQPQFETYSCNFDQPQSPRDSVDCQEALDKILEELEELKRDQRMLKELKKRIAKEQTAKENMSIEEMRHEEQLVDYKIKEIRMIWVLEDFEARRLMKNMREIVRLEFISLSKILMYGEAKFEKRRKLTKMKSMLLPVVTAFVYFNPQRLPIEEPDNSLNMGDEHLDTIPATESDEVIKSSVENLVPIPSEFEGISDDSCDVPICDIGRINVDSIAPIPSGIIEAAFDPKDDTSSDDDDFEDIEYISLEEVEQEEKEFDLEDVFQVQDVILREKLLNVHRLISNIESLKDNPIPIVDSDSSDTSFSHLDNSLPEFETFSDHSEETRSGNTTTHANYSLPEYESFYFDNPSIPRPPPEPPDIEKCFEPKAGILIIKEFKGVSKSHDFMTSILPTLVSDLPFISSTFSFENEDTIFDPGIVTFLRAGGIF